MTLNGTTDISPLGQMAPGLVVPKLEVPMKVFTKSTGSILGAQTACSVPKWPAMHKKIMKYFFIMKKIKSRKGLLFSQIAYILRDNTG